MSSWLVLTRTEVEPSAAELVAAVAPSDLPPVLDDPNAAAWLASIVGRAAEVAPRIQAYNVPPELAADLGASLSRSISELKRLNRQLSRRAGQQR